MKKPNIPQDPSLPDLVKDESIRTMVFVTMVCILLTFGALFLFKGAIAAGIPSAFALLAFFLRAFWPLVLYLFSMAYLLFVPEGVPGFLTSPSTFTLRDGPFKFADFVIIPCILASFISICRFIGITRQALPHEPETSYSKENGNVRRPGILVTDRELKILLISILIVTVVGQVIWFMLTRLQFDFQRWYLLTTVPNFGNLTGVNFPEPITRFMLLVLVGGGLAFALRLASWYWGLMQLTQDEARAIVTDGAWHEARRELCAIEKKRAEALAQAERQAIYKHQTRVKK